MPQEITTREETGRRRVRTVNDQPSQTIQSHVHRAEIKEIMRNYDATGVFTSLRHVDMTFRDVSEFEDYADMMQQSKQAEAAFMTLPSKLREVFNHSHLEWLDAAHNPEMAPELRAKLEKHGYLKAVQADPAEPAKADPPPPSGDE